MTEVPQGPETGVLRKARMVHEERWQEIQQLAAAHVTVSEIARMLVLDHKTVRRCLRQAAWQPYQRAANDTLLTTHAVWLAGRAPEVEYSARILSSGGRQSSRALLRPVISDITITPASSPFMLLRLAASTKRTRSDGVE